MPKFHPSQIPSAKRISMERFFLGDSHVYRTTKEIALYVGLKEKLVRDHLAYLKSRGKLPKDSPYHKQ